MSGFGSAFTLKAAAYRRGDQFDKRRRLMEAWAAFCEPKAAGKGVPMKKAK
jgi:hypothetical protein